MSMESEKQEFRARVSRDFIRAIQRGNKARIRQLCRELPTGGTFHGAALDAAHHALIQALRQDRLDLAKIMVEERLGVNGSPLFLSPLSVGALEGSLEFMDFLNQKGADLDAVCMGQTALTSAATYGQVDSFDWLVARGANFRWSSKEGLSAFSVAALTSRVEIGRRLIDLGFLDQFSPEKVEENLAYWAESSFSQDIKSAWAERQASFLSNKTAPGKKSSRSGPRL